MLDPDRYEKVSSGEAFAADTPAIYEELDNLSVEELLNLRSEIETRLPSTKLKDMDLEKELVLQYHKMVQVQARVAEDTRTPANQLAQVGNSVAATLQQLVTMQTKHHTSERFKSLENMLIKALRKLPKEVAEEFINEYERLEDE
jgi:hypothetical protein